MRYDEFSTIRDFNKNFPSKIFVCPKCKSLSEDPYFCNVCKTQINNFLYSEKTYGYTISENQKNDKIFMPIELIKGKISNRKTN